MDPADPRDMPAAPDAEAKVGVALARFLSPWLTSVSFDMTSAAIAAVLAAPRDAPPAVMVVRREILASVAWLVREEFAMKVSVHGLDVEELVAHARPLPRSPASPSFSDAPVFEDGPRIRTGTTPSTESDPEDESDPGPQVEDPLLFWDLIPPESEGDLAEALLRVVAQAPRDDVFKAALRTVLRARAASRPREARIRRDVLRQFVCDGALSCLHLFEELLLLDDISMAQLAREP